MGTPQGGRAYLATLPTCGPLLNLPPALKRWGPPKRQGLCSHVAHSWATSDSAPRSEAVGTPKRQGLFSHLAHLWATSYSAPRSEAVGTPPRGRGYVATLPTCGPPVLCAPRSEAMGTPQGGRGYLATLPTCGPLLNLPPALKPWGPPKRQGLCSHLAHSWATSHSAPRSEAVATPKAAGVI